jgi:hypothetical protein
MEHEMAMRQLGTHRDEQQKAEIYLKLREEFRRLASPSDGSVTPPSGD